MGSDVRISVCSVCSVVCNCRDLSIRSGSAVSARMTTEHTEAERRDRMGCVPPASLAFEGVDRGRRPSVFPCVPCVPWFVTVTTFQHLTRWQ